MSEFTDYSNIIARIQNTAVTCRETIEPCTNIAINGEIKRLGSHTTHLLRMAILHGVDRTEMGWVAKQLGLDLND